MEELKTVVDRTKVSIKSILARLSHAVDDLDKNVNKISILKNKL